MISTFYGLWVSKNDDIQQILSSGKWENKLSNTSRIRGQLEKLNIGDKIFIYQEIEGTKILNSPFANFASNIDSNASLVKVKSIATGSVKSVDFENNILNISFDSNFKSNEWYGFFRQDGIWALEIDNSNTLQQQKYKALYEIVFENKEQDYEWWSKNGLFKRKNFNTSLEATMFETQPLNQILYGPPGTGKTYHTINKALEIIDGVVPQDREEAKRRFEELRKNGQIEFVTFHQSYGYEEFVEGIKAETTDNGIEYKIEAGIFKKLSHKAKGTSVFNIGDTIGKYEIVSLSDELLKLQRENGSIIPIPMYLLNEVLALLLKKIITVDDLNNKTAVDKMSATTEKYIINGYPNVFRDLAQHYLIHQNNSTRKNENYILIIDEINRGNISKIFGELITLIEPSKRIGAEESLHVKLPYSGEPFGVPSNLYIIGTMNTADRSIALMDTALRRRFDFREMMPCSELLDFAVEGLHVKSMLETINQRIEYLYDRDHTIGHAYFMSLAHNPTFEELEYIFKNRIIPLLQEYFYDDWEKILMILGKDGFIEKTELKSDIFTYKNDDYIEEEQSTYKIKESFNFSEFIK